MRWIPTSVMNKARVTAMLVGALVVASLVTIDAAVSSASKPCPKMKPTLLTTTGAASRFRIAQRTTDTA